MVRLKKFNEMIRNDSDPFGEENDFLFETKSQEIIRKVKSSE